MCSIDSVGHSLGVYRGQKMSTLAGVLCDAEQDTGILWGGGDIHLLDVVPFTGDREAGLGALLGHCEFVTRCHKISDWLSHEAFTYWYNCMVLQYGLAVIIINLCVCYIPSNQGLHPHHGSYCTACVGKCEMRVRSGLCLKMQTVGVRTTHQGTVSMKKHTVTN